MLAVSVKTGALACAAAGLTYAYYRQKSYQEFGGITGDLAGYFVTLCEGVMAVRLARELIEHPVRLGTAQGYDTDPA